MLMDFANNYKGGGAYTSNAKAQEEGLTACTNLAHIIDSSHIHATSYPISVEEPGRYDPDQTAVLYVPGVCLLREGPKKNYHFREDPQQIDVVAVAARNHSGETQASPTLAPEEKEELRQKLIATGAAARAAGADTLILGALGTGVFKGSVPSLVEAYEELIPIWRTQFKRVIFAVPNDFGGKALSHAPEGTFNPFARMCSKFPAATPTPAGPASPPQHRLPQKREYLQAKHRQDQQYP
jgi:uncharacterized protein (TIGR02452 family)